MFKKEITRVISILKNSDVSVKDGMTVTEIIKTEEYYQIQFPFELKTFLMSVLPVSNGFYNWNDYSIENQKYIKQALNWPIEGILFDIEYNNLWLTDYWGIAPKKLEHKLKIAKQELQKVTKLIPIYSHRYLPLIKDKHLAPVLSVYQTDIIYYGTNLWNYFEHEFADIDYDFSSNTYIPFWSMFAE